MKKILGFLLLFCLLICSLSGCFSTDTPENPNNLGDYNVTIDSCRLAKDRQGDPIVIIQYTFTNNSSEARNFTWTISDTVFQNGVELNRCYSVPDTANYSSENQNKDVQSGHSITVEAAYVLIDEVSDISVEAKELISLSKKKVTKSFTIV